jgi:adenylylsulfate kinase
MSWAIWITGVPGSGKSTLARSAARELHALGSPVRVLELDEIRKTLTPSPTYSDAERDQVYRTLVYLAATLTEAGVPVIIDATAHRRAWRDLARREIPRFAEVQIQCPVDVARERERTRAPGHAPRDIYARAERPGAAVPGVNVPYEPALAPELAIDTAREDAAASAARIVALTRRLAAEPVRLDAPPPWAIWISGRPGSGKTTLAGRVAEAVVMRGFRVKVLDVLSLGRFLPREALVSESHQEIVHRALAYAAKLLVEAGVAVIVDASAPRRAWREAARALIPRFAEVQLRCPAEICVERERAARWRAAPPSGFDAPPDTRIEYEDAHRPELTLQTDAHDLWSLVDHVLSLINRLGRAAFVEGYAGTQLDEPGRR